MCLHEYIFAGQVSAQRFWPFFVTPLLTLSSERLHLSCMQILYHIRWFENIFYWSLAHLFIFQTVIFKDEKSLNLIEFNLTVFMDHVLVSQRRNLHLTETFSMFFSRSVKVVSFISKKCEIGIASFLLGFGHIDVNCSSIICLKKNSIFTL